MWVEILGSRRTLPRSRFGDFAVICFVLVQGLDGVFTYLGVRAYGVGVEANPLISAAIATVGLAAGLTAAKLVAVAFGILLHLRRVHAVVALLTAVYFTLAIVPWAALFFGR